MGAIEIHYTTLDSANGRMREFLSEAEYQRLLTYARSADRDRFLLGAAALRVAVGERLGVSPADVTVERACPDCDRPHGQPIIGGSRIWCSVSHSGPHVVVALSDDQEVGIDLETVEEGAHRWRSLLSHVLTPDELPPRDLRGFLRTWVRKEALLKLSGEGLRRPMVSIALKFPTSAQARGDERGESLELVAPPASLAHWYVTSI